jgi:probable phosphoglycerate mutase
MTPSVAQSTWTAFCDGGSRGNPGHAGYGVYIVDAAHAEVARIKAYIGIATNNVAEYRGLLAALEFVNERHVQSLHVISDSELMVNQILCKYKVRSVELQPLWLRAQALICRIPTFSIVHVLRSRNVIADRLVNEAIDSATATSNGEQTCVINA